MKIIEFKFLLRNGSKRYPMGPAAGPPHPQPRWFCHWVV